MLGIFEKKLVILHSFLFAAFPVVFLYAYNIGELPFVNIIWPLVAFVAFAGVLIFIIWLSSNNIVKAGLAVSIFYILTFSYGHLANILSASVKWYLFAFWILLYFAFFYLLARTKKQLLQINLILNIFSIVVMGMTIMQISYFMISQRQVDWTAIDPGRLIEQSLSASNPEVLPDIYYIIPDRYADADLLSEQFNFDNSEFINQLKEKGFYVVGDSRSNYLKTGHSLASSLNMEYINYLAEVAGADSTNYKPLYQKLNDHFVGSFLKNRGYSYIHLGSWWEATRVNTNADVSINIVFPSDFFVLLFSTSIIEPFSDLLRIDALSHLNIYETHYQRTRAQLESLKQVSKNEAPTFTLAHILLPHPPFVFSRDGEYISSGTALKEKNAENYLEQLLYANKALIDVVNTIFENSSIPPIIIIQSDEGPYTDELWAEPRGEKKNWLELDNDGLRRKTGILNAIYFPDREYANFYPGITPVNTFRIIFNHFFSTDYELLPDLTYRHRDDRQPYLFDDITEKIK